MSRKIPGSKRRVAARPTERERERFFDRLTQHYTPYGFDVPDPHPAMDRPGWRVFRGAGRQTRRDWIVGIVFLLAAVGGAGVIVLRSTGDGTRTLPIDGVPFARDDFQALVDRAFANADWYPHLLNVYEPDEGPVVARTDLSTDQAEVGIAERICADIASLPNVARVVVASALGDEVWTCSS